MLYVNIPAGDVSSHAQTGSAPDKLCMSPTTQLYGVGLMFHTPEMKFGKVKHQDLHKILLGG